MRSDIDRWNEKYARYQITGNITPDSLLTDNSPLLSGHGAALDIAAGTCDNALFLASLGYSSFAVDGSVSAVRIGRHKASANNLELMGFVADLESYALPQETFDVVVVIKYLSRHRIGAIKRSVKKGGLLFFKTFNLRFLDQKPSFPREYVLADGELGGWLLDWSCVKTNDDGTNLEPLSYWIGCRPTES